MIQRTCKTCKTKFETDMSYKFTCSEECAIKWAKKQKAKQDRDERRARRQEFGSIAIRKQDIKKQAQDAFNKYIRARDGKVCISCGYTPYVKDNVLYTRQFHAGHFMPSGNYAILTFDENNVHSQCSICNNHKSGNLTNYEPNLIEKIGIDEVTRLKTTRGTKRWSVEELRDITKMYKQKLKDLEDAL